MTKIAKSEAPAPNAVATNSPTLATLLAVLERDATQSETRLRDLRSAVKRVAVLLGNEPGALALDLSAISAQLATVSPVAVGMTVKRLTNIRSDFLAAVKTSGVIPIKFEVKNTLSPAWGELFSRLSGRRAHIGLSRLARYASSHRIEPGEINDTVIDKFIAAVREGSLHQNPRVLHRQVTLIWNEAARDQRLGLQSVTIASFRGPPKRIDWSLLPVSFRREVDDYLGWAGRSDPFAADARPRALAPRTLRLRRALYSCGRVGPGRNRNKASQYSFARRPRHASQLQKHFATSARARGRRGKRLQSRPQHHASSDCARMGER